LKLAFAITINKAQGQLLDRVGLLLLPEVFSHGQLYVGLSRVTDPAGISLVVPSASVVNGMIRNVVWAEIFTDPLTEQQAAQQQAAQQQAAQQAAQQNLIEGME